MMDFPNPLKAVLVDFDGTFVDSMPALRVCFDEFLEHYGIKVSETEFLSLIGPSLIEVVEKLRITHSLPGTLDTLYKEYCGLVHKVYAEKVEPFANALNILQNLKRRGIKIAIVTSAPSTLMEIFLPRFELETFFDALITSVKNEPTKPSPALYLRALKTLGVSGGEAIAIEDSANGVASAHTAGLYVVQFGSPTSAEGADFNAVTWEKIEEALNGYQTHELERSFEVKIVDSGEEFQLSDVEKNRVEELWEAAQKQYEGKLFNGKLLNYLDFVDGKLYGKFVEYKYYIAQRADLTLRKRLSIRPIAISCLCTFEEQALLGKRSALVTDFPGFFELVPSGGIDPSAAENGKVNLIKQALTELSEEAKIEPKDVRSCYPLVLFQDLITGGFEICMRIELKKIQAHSLLQNNEYSQLEWMAFSKLQKFAFEKKESFITLSLFLIEKYITPVR